jgi:bifunctional DNA-binding transcriptional regulator/antitoxin component of YhaV-PrlF toxin-antitoxin module
MVNMDAVTLRVDNQGRVLLPSFWRKQQQIRASTELCVTVNEDGGLVIETREQGLRRARALVRKYIPEGVSLSKEIIADHRAEAAREHQE